MLWSAGCWNTLILYLRLGTNLGCDLPKNLSRFSGGTTMKEDRTKVYVDLGTEG